MSGMVKIKIIVFPRLDLDVHLVCPSQRYANIVGIPSIYLGYNMNKIDGSYRLLFNNPHLVRDLFQGIINEPWLSALDWSQLKPLPSDYISDTLRQRQGDCVWQLP